MQTGEYSWEDGRGFTYLRRLDHNEIVHSRETSLHTTSEPCGEVKNGGEPSSSFTCRQFQTRYVFCGKIYMRKNVQQREIRSTYESRLLNSSVFPAFHRASISARVVSF
jgi:hypothetical protein